MVLYLVMKVVAFRLNACRGEARGFDRTFHLSCHIMEHGNSRLGGERNAARETKKQNRRESRSDLVVKVHIGLNVHTSRETLPETLCSIGKRGVHITAE